MRRNLVALGVCTLLAAISVLAAGASPLDVLVILPPRHSMAEELLPLLEHLEQAGADVDVAAYETGLYLFTEDSVVGGDVNDLPDLYEFEITVTYDSVQASDYDAIIMGPGYAHTFWVNEGLETVNLLLDDAVATHKILGGVSYGAVFLIGSGLIDGRSA